VDTAPPQIVLVAPAAGKKTVNGVVKDDPVVMTTVVGWATFSANVTDNLSGVATVVFKVDGVTVPAASVTKTGSTWSFQFTPDQKNEHVYTIQVIATDHAGNVATASTAIDGIKTQKK
jgi:hypothetical protein